MTKAEYQLNLSALQIVNDAAYCFRSLVGGHQVASRLVWSVRLLTSHVGPRNIHPTTSAPVSIRPVFLSEDPDELQAFVDHLNDNIAFLGWVLHAWSIKCFCWIEVKYMSFIIGRVGLSHKMKRPQIYKSFFLPIWGIAVTSVYRSKFGLYTVAVGSLLLCGSETWPSRTKDMGGLSVFN